MHVLIIPSWYPETPEDVDGIFFRLQAQALQRSGLKIGVTAPVFRSMRGKPASVVNGGYGIRSYTEENIPTYVYKSMYFFPRLPYLDRHRWVGAGWKLFKCYVRDHGTPDIIHAHSMNHAGILAQQIHEKTGIPFVLTEHSSTYARKLIRNWQRPAMLQSAQQCSARIAVSKDFCRLLETEYGGLDWQYIPNSLSPAFIRHVDLANKPKNADFTFCSVAHLNYNKGFDILLPAFAEALKIHPDLKLKIGGMGLIASQLHNLAAELGLENSVEFLGGLQNDQVLDLMFRSDAFVLASRNETFGVVFIEALSQGLPVAATRCGGPQTIINENNGILVPVGDVQALAGALVSLYENRGRYDAQTLRADCLNEFGEEAVVRQITAVYKTILGGTHES